MDPLHSDHARLLMAVEEVRAWHNRWSGCGLPHAVFGIRDGFPVAGFPVVRALVLSLDFASLAIF
jgi:hypothetical protein